MIDPKSNPTWTIDPHYWWNPFEDVDTNHATKQEFSVDKAKSIFKPTLTGKIFNNKQDNPIGFLKND